MQQLVIPASFGSIGRACEFVVQVARDSGIDDSRTLFQIELAVDEACTNVVEHGYGGSSEGEIHLACGIGDFQGKPHFLIRLRDKGVPFNPASVSSPEISSQPEELQVGGLGIHFMRKTMDHVEFGFREGWNELLMAKCLPQELR